MAKPKLPQEGGEVSNKLLQRLIAASSSKLTSRLTESVVMNNKDNITTAIPAINIALSGEVDGGLLPGLLLIAGPSKHFKTLFMLILMKAYMDKYPDSVGYLFDSEFGAALEYFDALGIDGNRVVHNPIGDIEQLKHEAMSLLNTIERGDKVFLAIDSTGNLASKKETDDALDNKQVVDMTRAKAYKSFGRMITPQLTLKDVPMVGVGHTYQTLEMFSKAVLSGGTGLYYSANDIWIVGRQQEKATSGDKELLGWNFIINIEKSRKVKEKSKIPVTVLYKGGISKYSALLELAEEAKFISGDNKSGYTVQGIEGQKFKLSQLGPVFEKLLTNEKFTTYVKEKYKVAGNSLISTELDDVNDLED